MTTERTIRVLLAKPGLDGHDRGVKVLACALQEAGMAVISMGLRQQPEQMVEAAIQAEANVVGLSCLSGAHLFLLPRVVELLEMRGVTEVLVLGGGTIPARDIPALQARGVQALFGPGTSLADIVAYIRAHAPQRPAADCWATAGAATGPAAAHPRGTKRWEAYAPSLRPDWWTVGECVRE